MTRDVMNLLAEARPAGLDPADDAARRERDLHNAMKSPAGPRRGEVASRPRRRLTLGLGAVAVGAAATVAVTTVGHGTRTPSTPHSSQAGTTTLSARQILLAAAQAAEKQPTGRYWRIHYVSGAGYRVGGKGAGGYQVYLTDETDQWTPRDPGKDDDVTYGHRRPSGPLTAADRAAWQKAGSPGRWNVTSNGDPLTLTTKADPWAADRTTPTERAKTIQETQKRCASPSPGDKNLCEKVKDMDNASSTSRFEAFKQRLARNQDDNSQKLMVAYDFLTAHAVSPADRAKAFRLLADLPGIHSVGTVKNTTGRSGIGLSTPEKMHDGSGTELNYQLILDPKTYTILGDQQIVTKAGGVNRGMKPGTVLDYNVILDNGWTSDAPHHT